MYLLLKYFRTYTIVGVSEYFKLNAFHLNLNLWAHFIHLKRIAFIFPFSMLTFELMSFCLFWSGKSFKILSKRNEWWTTLFQHSNKSEWYVRYAFHTSTAQYKCIASHWVNIVQHAVYISAHCTNAIINSPMRWKATRLNLDSKSRDHINSNSSSSMLFVTISSTFSIMYSLPPSHSLHFAWLANHKWKSIKASIKSLNRKWNNQTNIAFALLSFQTIQHARMTYLECSIMHILIMMINKKLWARERET